tara:strand:- start:227 stop:412 length:186 start_codon:yes stop_codon:yes gene_type:complete
LRERLGERDLREGLVRALGETCERLESGKGIKVCVCVRLVSDLRERLERYLHLRERLERET